MKWIIIAIHPARKTYTGHEWPRTEEAIAARESYREALDTKRELMSSALGIEKELGITSKEAEQYLDCSFIIQEA